MNDVSVYKGTHADRERDSDQKNAFVQAFFVLNKEQHVFLLCECSKLQDRNSKKRPQVHSFDQGSLPRSAYLGTH